ncbi:MAG TPA: large conductance mechanosensitive channel protein MscL [candidate division WOR-3 bacterium]|uniref:Large-conductance mechanosensitive channel n=1 Tax=candidate division WOR-3 bacterium TaxID=2052148 RepID=A0A7V0T4X3_UNCW3|nr:large conductance mechanosensitive channel protein MscL [candidate division WOR-3 bacterium]
MLKEFIIRGNVVDLAVGIIIGGAFGTIVRSLVADVIMPPIGLLLGNIDFANLFIVLKAGAEVAGPYATLADAQAAGATTVNYGVFINSIVSFLIVGFAVFLLIRQVNRLKREKPAPPAEPTEKDCTRRPGGATPPVARCAPAFHHRPCLPARPAPRHTRCRAVPAPIRP